MDARKLTTIFSYQKEKLLSHDLLLLCDRMEEGQLSPSSNLARIVNRCAEKTVRWRRTDIPSVWFPLPNG